MRDELDALAHERVASEAERAQAERAHDASERPVSRGFAGDDQEAIGHLPSMPMSVGSSMTCTPFLRAASSLVAPTLSPATR